MSRENGIVVGLDVGTTNIKAAAFDLNGHQVSHASHSILTTSPQPGWMEQDPLEIVSLSQRAIKDAIDSATADPSEVIALGIANHTETLIIWNRATGEPILPAILWSCRRGADEIRQLATPNMRTLIQSRTGLVLDATFTAAKLAWIFKNLPEVAQGLRSGEMLFGTVDTWLTWQFTVKRSYVTEAGNASRTMLFDIGTLQFDPELAALFGLDISVMPEIRKTNALFGTTDATLFGARIPIHAIAGDQQAALFGHGCLNTGETKITFGTGAFIWTNAGAGSRPEKPEHGIVETIAWDLSEPTYAYEGFVMNAGRSLAWLSEHLAIEGGVEGLIKSAIAVGESGGVLMVPAFNGLAAPWWDNEVRAAILGISNATEVGHIAHAGLEAVAHQIRDLLDLIRGSPGAQVTAIHVDGGLTHSEYFIQLQADILQVPLKVSDAGFVSAKGVALMAGLGAGIWRQSEIAPDSTELNLSSEFQPGRVAWAEQSHAQWRTVVGNMISFKN